MAESNNNKSFAEKQLAKFGWKKGMGLGRLNDGIAEPLRVKIRADKSGIGHDSKEDFSHWWDNAYNKAVNKLTVVTSVDGSVEVKSSKDSSICATKPNVFKSSVLYDNFDQKGTLTGATYEANVSDSESDSEEETNAVSTTSNGLLLDMSDDQLFKLCGGATAHKGARHGIRMTAKMKRLEAMVENDASLVADWKRKEEEHQAAKTPINKVATMPTKLWKNRTTSNKAVIPYQYEEIVHDIEDSCSENDKAKDVDHAKKQKKKSKKEKRNSKPCENFLEHGEEENILAKSPGHQREKIKKSNKDILSGEREDRTCDEPKKKKRKRNELENDENEEEESDIADSGIKTPHDNFRDEDARRENRINCSTDLNSRVVEEEPNSSKRKSKKKSKKRTEPEDLQSMNEA